MTHPHLLFADDCKAVGQVASNSHHLLLQPDLDVFCTWSCTWKCPLNFYKYRVLQFYSSSSNHSKNTYLIHITPIECTSQHRDLGVIFSDDLSWTPHLYLLSFPKHSMFCSSYVPRSISVSHSPNTKCILYLTLVRSQIAYCSHIWRPHIIDHFRNELFMRLCTDRVTFASR